MGLLLSEAIRTERLCTADVLAAPELLLVESANALWKRNRRGFAVPSASSVLKLVDDAGIVLVPSRDLIADAWRVAQELDHPVCDCVYLTLAFRMDGILLTIDARLAAKLEKTRYGKSLEVVG